MTYDNKRQSCVTNMAHILERGLVADMGEAASANQIIIPSQERGT
jgi:hypothetical protein